MTKRMKFPQSIFLIGLLMFLTIFRAQTILFIPKVEMYGGIAPNAWFGPWVSDAIIGFLVPVMLFLLLKRRSIRVWGLLVLYNAVGAFDYSQGLITQWLAPLPEQIASAGQVYGGIGAFMLFQLVALALLFRSDVIHHFSSSHSARYQHE